MAVDIEVGPVVLPAGVTAGAVDNASIVKLPTEDSTVEYLTNSDVYPEPGMLVLVTLLLADNKVANLLGPIGERQIMFLKDGKGSDLAYTFHATSHKVLDDEEPYPGFFKGTLQFSRFRWVVRELVPCTEEDFKAAEKANAAERVKHEDGQALFDSAVESIKAGKNEEAIVMLTQALKTCELDDELEADEDEDQEDPHASLRLRVLAARAGAAFNLKAYRSVIRDTELIERIYGRPMDVMNAIDDKEDLAAYFRSVLRSAQAYEALGDRQNAGAGYMAIMILKMITQQGEDEGQTIDLIAPEVADELTAVAGKALENLEADADKVPVYTLKISLLGVEPTIYRTLEVTGTTSLGDLKTFIVFAFGWAGFDELEDHEFQVYDHGIVRFTSLPDDFVVPDGEDSDILDVCEDEDTATLTLVAPKVGDTFTFHYEKADWVHQIVVENIREENIGCDHDHDAEEEHEHEHPQYPKCIAGARACPPDGLGGPAGYAEFLKAANGEATTKFATKLEALEYARDNLGLCNSGLDSWGGAVKRSLEAALTGEAVEEEEDDTPKDVEKGGWNSEAFDLEEVNKALTVISSTMQDDEDEWEDDDEEEEDVEEDI